MLEFFHSCFGILHHTASLIGARITVGTALKQHTGGGLQGIKSIVLKERDSSLLFHLIMSVSGTWNESGELRSLFLF